MSGSQALAVVQGLGKLFGGYGTVTLGPIVLQDLELPKSIPIGGKQRVTVHILPGGARQINTMGPDYSDISWQGIFVGQGASERVRLVNAMYVSGTPVTLAWDVYSYTVLVTEFSCDTRISGKQTYKIACTVQQDNTNPTGTTLADLASQVTSDIETGNPVAALSAVSQGVVDGPVGAAASAANVPGATTVGSGLYQDAVGAVNSAAGAINTAVSDVNNTLAPIGLSLGSVSAAAGVGLDTLGMAGGISTAVSACGDLANLSQAAGYFSRAATNLANASA